MALTLRIANVHYYFLLLKQDMSYVILYTRYESFKCYGDGHAKH